MRILALDTSTLTASAALLDGDVVLGECELDVSGHTVDLLERIADVMRDMPWSSVDAVAVGAGPGSFTGLRVGMATAKGIAFAASRPLWVVSSLAALAWGAARDGVIIAALDARRGELYAGFYRRDGGRLSELAPERVMAPPELASAIAAVGGGFVVGDALIAHREALLAFGDGGGVRATPSAVAVAQLAARGDRVDMLDRGAPAYVRPSEAEVKYPNGVPGALRSQKL